MKQLLVQFPPTTCKDTENSKHDSFDKILKPNQNHVIIQGRSSKFTVSSNDGPLSGGEPHRCKFSEIIMQNHLILRQR